MSELRKDPIVGRWVIIAPDRAKRPEDYTQEFRVAPGNFCPFCEGNEFATANEILAYRQPGSERNGKGWRVRVIPNKFPALQVEGSLNKRGDGIYDVMNGVGAHEVIIECPQHHVDMSQQTVETIREVLWVYRDRLVDLKRDQRLVHGMIFKNKGAPAGASLEHSHSQLIVTPVVPITVAEEMKGSHDFYHFRGRCIYCDMVHQELNAGARIVVDTPLFVAFCPFASRFPFETWIVPKHHSSHYESIQRPAIEDLGSVLKGVLGRLEAALDNPAYNFVLHTAPFDTVDLKHYHWHIEIFPRLTRVAGFEWGSGFYINSVPPEEAGKFLREVELDAPTHARFAV
ncbi:MAG: galactose-1-phosphate uridylyltransferase [Planctomycetaceae bacterium]|nr:galactose-1-phosphate uridylyltransferase [Planctomycetaceae bacterium]